MARDLEILKADLVGHSFRGANAIRAANQQSEKVRRRVVISSPYARSGWYPEAQRSMSKSIAHLDVEFPERKQPTVLLFF